MKKTLLTALCLAGLFLITISTANAQVSIGFHISVAPPALPVYEQPFCPDEGYIWTPGYWAYGPDGYYWVPGAWILAPQPGFLWTPGYWAFVGGYYRWHHGYWGAHVGYYGGINYGFGYTGMGFWGGRWVGNVYRYNTSVTRVNTTIIHNTYVDNTYINNVHNKNRYSYNGPGGITRRPTTEEMTYSREKRTPPTARQRTFATQASKNRNQLASVNNGRPERLFRENKEGEMKHPDNSIGMDHKASERMSRRQQDGQMKAERSHTRKQTRELKREAKAERKAERRKERQ